KPRQYLRVLRPDVGPPCPRDQARLGGLTPQMQTTGIDEKRRSGRAGNGDFLAMVPGLVRSLLVDMRSVLADVREQEKQRQDPGRFIVSMELVDVLPTRCAGLAGCVQNALRLHRIEGSPK